MHHHSSFEPGKEEQSTSVTLIAVQSEVCVSRGTLTKYLAFPGIEPICFHIGTRSLSLSRDELERVTSLNHQLPMLALLTSSSPPCSKAEKARCTGMPI